MQIFIRFGILVLLFGLSALGLAQTSETGGPLVPLGRLTTQPDSTQSGAFFGSVSSEPLHDGTIDLTLAYALERGLKVNLGLFVSGTELDARHAQHWREISELLPHLEGSLGESTHRINLHAMGIPLSNIPRSVDVNNSDARVTFTQSLVDLSAIDHARAVGAAESATRIDYLEARETVVVAVSNAYLLVAQSEARVDSAEADLKTAESLYELATDRERAGLSAEVDTLRARVELESRRERVIDAKNALAKQKIVLLRLIGLDIRQPIRLATDTSYRPVAFQNSETAQQQALEFRKDYQSAQEQIRSAELRKRAAQFERMPRIGVAADYGALGTTPGNAVATWNAGIRLRLPLFEGVRIQSDIAEAESQRRQKEAEIQDLRTRISQEVENAILDLETSRQQVEVAQTALTYANRALVQSRDRFGAGVTNNIEVLQAQDALAGARERWLDSIYRYNIAQVLLARATGTAETTSHRLFNQPKTSSSPHE
jgi:outer membrane protein TolC